MACQNKETDLIETPKLTTFRQFDKDPTEEKRIKREQDQRMCEGPVVFQMRLPAEEAENKIGVREDSHGHTAIVPHFPTFSSWTALAMTAPVIV